MTKPIKIITNEVGWDTKIFIDNKDITKEIDGIWGIDVEIRVDAIPKITIHRYGEKIDFESKAYKLDIKNYKPKKADNNVSEITDFNCGGIRKYKIEKDYPDPDWETEPD